MGGKFGFPDDAEETPDTQQALWEYDGYSMIWEHATAVGQGPYMRDHGVAFHGNNGVLVVDRGGWEVLPETETTNGKKRYRMQGEPRRGSSGDMSLAHMKDFLDCMDTRARPASDVEVGHNSMIACHLGNIAFRTGRRVQWSLASETITGAEDIFQPVDKTARIYRRVGKTPPDAWDLAFAGRNVGSEGCFGTLARVSACLKRRTSFERSSGRPVSGWQKTRSPSPG